MKFKIIGICIYILIGAILPTFASDNSGSGNQESWRDALRIYYPKSWTAKQMDVSPFVLANRVDSDVVGIEFMSHQNGQIVGAMIGIKTKKEPYDHDYSVCRRFNGYQLHKVSHFSLTHSYYEKDNKKTQESLQFPLACFLKDGRMEYGAMMTAYFGYQPDKGLRKIIVDSYWLSAHAWNDNAWKKGDIKNFKFKYAINYQIWSSEPKVIADIMKSCLKKLSSKGDVFFSRNDLLEAPLFFIEKFKIDSDSKDGKNDKTLLSIKNLTDHDLTIEWSGWWDKRGTQGGNRRIEIQPDRPESFTLPHNTKEKNSAVEIKLNTPWIFEGMFSFREKQANKNSNTQQICFVDKIFTGNKGFWWAIRMNQSFEAEQLNYKTDDSYYPRKDEVIPLGNPISVVSSVEPKGAVILGRTLSTSGLRRDDVEHYKGIEFTLSLDRGSDFVKIGVELETPGPPNDDIHIKRVSIRKGRPEKYKISFNKMKQGGWGREVPLEKNYIKAILFRFENPKSKPMKFKAKISNLKLYQ